MSPDQRGRRRGNRNHQVGGTSAQLEHAVSQAQQCPLPQPDLPAKTQPQTQVPVAVGPVDRAAVPGPDPATVQSQAQVAARDQRVAQHLVPAQDGSVLGGHDQSAVGPVQDREVPVACQGVNRRSGRGPAGRLRAEGRGAATHRAEGVRVRGIRRGAHTPRIAGWTSRVSSRGSGVWTTSQFRLNRLAVDAWKAEILRSTTKDTCQAARSGTPEAVSSRGEEG